MMKNSKDDDLIRVDFVNNFIGESMQKDNSISMRFDLKCKWTFFNGFEGSFQANYKIIVEANSFISIPVYNFGYIDRGF